jgi:hypothetical protein
MEPRWILDYFQNAISAGKRFRADETVQIGWMVTKLVEAPGGDLEVWEPQFRTVPIQWVRGINNTLRQLILQKSVAELLQIEPLFPSVLQAGIVIPPVWDQQSQFYLLRGSPMQNDSGWRISCDEKDRVGGQYRSLFEIGCRFPSLVPFLALPPGASVVRTVHDTLVRYRGAVVSSHDNELLQGVQNTGVIWS